MFASYCIESGIVYIHAGCNCKAMLLTYYTFWSFIVVDICFFILGQRYLRDQATLRRTIATYDVRKAQLSDAKDRDMLLKFVDELFRKPICTSSDSLQNNHALQNGCSTDASLSDATSRREDQRHQDYVDEHQDGLRRYSTRNADANQNLNSNVENVPKSSTDANLQKGLEAFNKLVQERVPKELPVTGMRSWKVLSYIPAVLVYATKGLCYMYDVYSYGPRPDQAMVDVIDRSSYLSSNLRPHIGGAWDFRSLLALSWKLFVLFPFYGYIHGAILAGFYKLQMKTGLRYWHSVILFIIPYLLLVDVGSWPSLVLWNLRSWCVVSAIGGQQDNYMLIFAPFFGLRNFLVSDYYGYKNDEYLLQYQLEIAHKGWIDVLTIIFLVLPISFFTYYIYEPSWSRQWRPEIWSSFYGWVTDAESKRVRERAMKSRWQRD